MRTRFRSIAAALALPCLLVPSRNARADDAPSKPPAELDQMTAFVGSFRCEGKTLKSPLGGEHPTRASVTGKRDLDGFWLTLHYEEKKTKENPTPIKAVFYWGYDAGGKKFFGVMMNSLGGWVAQTSPGWDGEKMVWMGKATMDGREVLARDTFTKKSDREILHTGERSFEHTKWSVVDEETCKR
jgi:hypothetical protein